MDKVKIPRMLKKNGYHIYNQRQSQKQHEKWDYHGVSREQREPVNPKNQEVIQDSDQPPGKYRKQTQGME